MCDYTGSFQWAQEAGFYESFIWKSDTTKYEWATSQLASKKNIEIDQVQFPCNSYSQGLQKVSGLYRQNTPYRWTV